MCVGSCLITVENCCRCNIRLGYRSGVKRKDKDHLYLHFLLTAVLPSDAIQQPAQQIQHIVRLVNGFESLCIILFIHFLFLF